MLFNAQFLHFETVIIVFDNIDRRGIAKNLLIREVVDVKVFSKKLFVTYLELSSLKIFNNSHTDRERD